MVSWVLGGFCVQVGQCSYPLHKTSVCNISSSRYALSSEVVSSAHCSSLDGEALLLHLSLLVLLKFRVCSEQLQVDLQMFHRYTISSIP